MVDLTSSGPLPDLPDLPDLPTSSLPQRPARASEPVETEGDTPEIDGAGMFWLDGDVLMCACPDCGAPMTVRLWLMIADCWRCEASIELTEEQEREARRMLQRRAPQTSAESSERSPGGEAPRQDDGRNTAVATVSYVAVAPAPSTRRRPRVTHEPVAPPRASTTFAQQVRRRREVGRRVSNWLHSLLRDMPAWLISQLTLCQGDSCFPRDVPGVGTGFALAGSR